VIGGRLYFGLTSKTSSNVCKAKIAEYWVVEWKEFCEKKSAGTARNHFEQDTTHKATCFPDVTIVVDSSIF